MPTFLIPAYNEEKRIRNCISVITREFPDSSCIVVFDGNDRTPDVVSRYSSVKLIRFNNRVGKGRAIIEGLKRISLNDIVIIMDADMPVDVSDINRAEEAFENNDMLIVQRIYEHAPESRLFLHNSYMALAKLFFPQLRQLPDWQGGFKLLKASSVGLISEELVLNDFLFDTNLVYSFLKHNMKLKLFPVRWKHEEEESKVSRHILKVIMLFILSLVKMRAYYSPLRKWLYSKSFLAIQARIQKFLR
ncbi:MAG: glycosyltransferase [Nitrososphaerota archaeon]|jgi:glycosyltransferase involved in cell wall biosynthesis|nr:glycosyltransferase [Nitrososphaerota archaeon]MDG6930854.1 glycosyltransferase [Nitrososphaerota archaeon]